MSVIAYARVSSADQNLASQLEKLEEHGYDRLYKEKATGTNTDRSEWQKVMEFVREGDTLIVTRMDRIGRSVVDLANIVETLSKKGVALKILAMNIDTSTTEGRAFIGMLSVFAEFETNIRKDRQMEGIAKAQKDGVKFGRKALDAGTVEKIKSLKAEGMSVREIAKELKLSAGAVSKYGRASGPSDTAGG